MGHSVTLGGERVGSGSKSKVYLRNYERSTHNLSYDWLSTMGCGMLIPFMCELVTRDDKYEINLKAGLRTIPTKGPLFGSFKMQLDVFQCPLRLYQALLHNNPLAIGLKANQVKFPKIKLYDEAPANTIFESKSANNSLIKYLGISGLGTLNNEDSDSQIASRTFFGAHVLAYYDIFKNYYANKQEENAYTLSTQVVNSEFYNNFVFQRAEYNEENEDFVGFRQIAMNQSPQAPGSNMMKYSTSIRNFPNFYRLYFNFTKPEGENETMDLETLGKQEVTIVYNNGEDTSIRKSGTLYELQKQGLLDFFIPNDWNNGITAVIQIYNSITEESVTEYFNEFWITDKVYWKEEEVVLSYFKLKNIDDMRYYILSQHTLGESVILDGNENYVLTPYFSALGDDYDYLWKKPLSGICVKTYQSDIFNNWLNTEIIDGENGIAEITAISTSSGSITIDALQFSEKLYNLLNRIAVSGGTYEDYLDAAYTASAKRFEESPIWIGGMSDEVIFEEIVQTAPADDSQLGTLGGRGNLLGKKKGGKITVKIDEPSLLIGIVSITPRIVYTQGNKWFNTEIDSLQDIHVPALDAIGFQNLMAETMHFGSTIIDAMTGLVEERPIIGKIPAWLHYMTNFDQAYGDFAATDGDGYMVLNRNYECNNGILQDATTYIDPAKFNYAFAYTKREAQNFWVKIRCNIKARRLMSAKQIPTA